MQPFVRHEGIAAPLPDADVDTDQILPARFLKKPREAGYGRFLFHDRRFDGTGAPRGDFVLDRPPYDAADVLLAGANFGCGSSREGAVYALVDHGIRAVLAPSFGDIFRNNALKNGLLPVALPAETVAAAIAAVEARPGARVAIDLPEETVTLPDGTTAAFEIDPFRRDLLLKGVDELRLTLDASEGIAAFEAEHAARWPWAAVPGGPDQGA